MSKQMPQRAQLGTCDLQHCEYLQKLAQLCSSCCSTFCAQYTTRDILHSLCYSIVINCRVLRSSCDRAGVLRIELSMSTSNLLLYHANDSIQQYADSNRDDNRCETH
jgi:hypothetical protein